MSIDIQEVVTKAHIHSDVVSLKFLSAHTVRELNVSFPAPSSFSIGGLKDHGKADITIWSDDLGYVKIEFSPDNFNQEENIAKIVQTIRKLFN